ncbi:hypothetical protein MHO82_21505 [Vibrio sp. Of7-15]|uniref:hypothetical protein n=1 Tax=Vibrio sp. Of7-15 TaxID=2724879 RepID=UPI001EF30339|nr:hypothetical protein [Vibrio sp. Of7-15]MCG7499448.1 hypothetical protein [Vibrio sp. Of7-15]
MIFAILFKVYLSAVVVLNPSAYSTANSIFSVNADEKVLICTTTGLKWVNVADLLSENKQSSPGDAHFQLHCPILKNNNQYSFQVVVAHFLPYLSIAPFKYTFAAIPAQFSGSKKYLEFAPKQSPPALVIS